MLKMLEILFYIYTRYVFPSSFLLGVFLVITSLLGINTGFHQGYVNRLIKVFEWCHRQIEKREKIRNPPKTPTKTKRKKDVENEILHGDVFYSGSLPGELETDSYSDNSDSGKVHMPGNLYKKVVYKIEHQEVEVFKLDRCMNYARTGCMAIIEDDVTKRFDSKDLPCWNLLTRTNRSYQFAHPRLALYFAVGFFIRFLVLLPIRLCIMIFGLFFLLVTTFLVGFIPDGRIKKFVYRQVAITAFRIMGRSLSIIMTTHQEENIPRNGGICVANHTTPIDVIIMSCDNAYALVGQLQPGLLGVLSRALNRATHHVFFDRFQVNDRAMVSQTLKEHASDTSKLPILIFPEGTCVNNSAVMMFKKGAFEASDVIYPVAIKYDQRFGDPFWNSSRDGFAWYMLMMMTSWAIVCEVWYLPAMHRKVNESAVDFAGRAKSEIAKQGGLVDLDWDGQLKRLKVKADVKSKLQKIVAEKMS